MEWLLLIPVVALGLYGLLLGIVCLLRIGHIYLLAALDLLKQEVEESVARVANSRQERAERRRMEHRFAVAAGATSDVDDDAVAARRQMPIIRRVVNEDLPRAIVRCMRVHLFAARAVGARYVWEIADEPECAGSRQRVIGIAGAAVELHERYPYLVEDPQSMANLITLRSHIVPTCRACPYLHHQVSNAPLLCPTAITARINGERFRDDVH
jgi:hypothetical protein